MTSGTDPIKGIKDWKRYVDRVEPEAFSGVTDTIDKTKDKLLAIAGLNRDNKEDKTDTTSNEGIFSGTNTNTNTDTDNKNFDFTYGGLNPTNFR